MSELSAFRDRYDHDMARAHDTYSDVIQAIRQLEVPARITQTGGMCLAVEWDRSDGTRYLLTDYEDSLPWNRDHHEGWSLGRYDEECNLLGDVAQTPDPRVEAAVELVVRTVLGPSAIRCQTNDTDVTRMRGHEPRR